MNLGSKNVKVRWHQILSIHYHANVSEEHHRHPQRRATETYQNLQLEKLERLVMGLTQLSMTFFEFLN